MPNPQDLLDLLTTLQSALNPFSGMDAGVARRKQDVSGAYDSLVGGFRGAMPRAAALADKTRPVADAINEAASYDMTGGLGVPALGMIRAYHGTPHLFDTYDASKIGTGEGAQSYGHGFYFAENPEVAKQYAQQFSSHSAKDQFIRHRLQNGKWAVDDTISGERLGTFDTGDEAARAWDAARQQGEIMQSVTLRPERTDLLDWDKPLSQQSPKVREAIAEVVSSISTRTAQNGPVSRAIESVKNGTASGADLYNLMSYKGGAYSGEDASRVLADAGIPGIKYLDQGSRGVGKGTSNFVIFDPKDISVDAVNGYQLRGSPSRISPFTGPFSRQSESPEDLAQLLEALQKINK